MMTNLKWLILAGLLLSVLRLDAQTVVGQVADEQGQPLPYANVAFSPYPTLRLSQALSLTNKDILC